METELLDVHSSHECPRLVKQRLLEISVLLAMGRVLARAWLCFSVVVRAELLFTVVVRKGIAMKDKV